MRKRYLLFGIVFLSIFPMVVSASQPYSICVINRTDPKLTVHMAIGSNSPLPVIKWSCTADTSGIVTVLVRLKPRGKCKTCMVNFSNKQRKKHGTIHDHPWLAVYKDACIYYYWRDGTHFTKQKYNTYLGDC